MNILDIIVIAIILLFLFRGFVKGFVYSIFDVGTYFIAAFVAANYNKYITEFLKNTFIYEKINEAINHVIINNTNKAIEVTNLNLLDSVNNSLDSMVIPVQTKQMILDNLSTCGLFRQGDVLSNLSNVITGIIITILSIILIFILVKVILSVIAFFIHQIMRLPILSTINRLFGGVFGIVSGLFVIYIVFGIFLVFNITNTFKSLPTLIDNSIIAKNFFYNNILLEYFFKH